MSRKLENMKKLSRLSDMMLDLSLARLAESSQKKAPIMRSLLELDQDLRALLTSSSNTVTDLDLYSHNENWQTWRRNEKKNLNSKLAELEANTEVCRIAAKTAFGRSRALKGVVTKLSE